MQQLSISNIAWESCDEEAILKLLKAKGVQGIEIAPTKIWPNWQDITSENLRRYRDKLHSQGFQIPALQAILFGYSDYKIFGSTLEQQNTLKHLRLVSDIAAELGAKVIVLGAPRNRDRGELDETQAFAIAIDFFQEIGEYCAAQNTCLCIEPNPPTYACNFITNSQEGSRLVRAVNSAGFGLHLDAAGMHLANENLESALRKNIDILHHFHISEPNLGNFAKPVVNHREIALTLRNLKYSNWVSIEMRSNPNNSFEPVETVVDYCIFNYLQQ